MLDYARQRAKEILRIPQKAVLATSGPAGLLLTEVPCEAVDLAIYLLLPPTCDHVFNLENDGAATMLTPLWELRGQAKILPPEKSDLPILHLPERNWSVLVQVMPSRIQILRDKGWGNAETIDLSTRPDLPDVP
jgi:hypothetical protein